MSRWARKICRLSSPVVWNCEMNNLSNSSELKVRVSFDFDIGKPNAAVKWAAKERSGFADPSSTACYLQYFNPATINILNIPHYMEKCA